MRRPLAPFPALLVLAAGATLAWSAPLQAQGKATARMKPPPVDAREAIDRRLGPVGGSGLGSGRIGGVDPRGSGRGSGTVGRGGNPWAGCGAWLNGRGWAYPAQAGARTGAQAGALGRDGGVYIGLGNGVHAGRSPLFWHRDHLGDNSPGGCRGIADVAGRRADSHDTLHRQLEREHDAWHARYPRARSAPAYWQRQHEQLHRRLEQDHGRWHGRNNYDWGGDGHGAVGRARGSLGGRG